MPGEIVHFELLSENADRAQGFWEGLFGWSFEGSGMPDMDYRMAPAGGGQTAALYASDDRPGHFKVYLSTDDINASVARVRELGGRADDRSPVPGHGWFSACADTEGTQFHLWQPDPEAG